MSNLTTGKTSKTSVLIRLGSTRAHTLVFACSRLCVLRDNLSCFVVDAQINNLQLLLFCHHMTPLKFLRSCTITHLTALTPINHQFGRFIKTLSVSPYWAFNLHEDRLLSTFITISYFPKKWSIWTNKWICHRKGRVAAAHVQRKAAMKAREQTS